MKLNDALPRLKDLELKASEVYLRHSMQFVDIEVRQFFADMADQELAHARALDEILRKAPAEDLEIEITGYQIDEEK